MEFDGCTVGLQWDDVIVMKICRKQVLQEVSVDAMKFFEGQGIVGGI